MDEKIKYTNGMTWKTFLVVLICDPLAKGFLKIPSQFALILGLILSAIGGIAAWMLLYYLAKGIYLRVRRHSV